MTTRFKGEARSKCNAIFNLLPFISVAILQKDRKRLRTTTARTNVLSWLAVQFERPNEVVKSAKYRGTYNCFYFQNGNLGYLEENKRQENRSKWILSFFKHYFWEVKQRILQNGKSKLKVDQRCFPLSSWELSVYSFKLQAILSIGDTKDMGLAWTRIVARYYTIIYDLAIHKCHLASRRMIVTFMQLSLYYI